MPARSTCRYVRLITLNVPHVPWPCFIAPLKNWSKLSQTLIIKNTNIGKYLHQSWCRNLKGLIKAISEVKISTISKQKTIHLYGQQQTFGQMKNCQKSCQIYRQSSIKNQLAKILQVIIPSTIIHSCTFNKPYTLHQSFHSITKLLDLHI